MEKAARADTLQLEIVHEGKTTQVWAKRPNRLRWDRGAGAYQIDDGKRLWLVDEKANRATTRPSAYFATDGAGLDLKAIHDRAITMGLIDKNAKPPPQQLLQLILHSGFSTSKKVTKLAGRGVGVGVTGGGAGCVNAKSALV